MSKTGDYINRKEYVNRLNDEQVEYDEFYKGLGKAKVIADDMPSVDAVEVVRCKECKHKTKMGFCLKLADYECFWNTPANFFCKWGEKNE